MLVRRLLNEMLFDSNSEKDTLIVNKFVHFAKNYLSVEGGVVELLFTREELVTTASYSHKHVRVYAKDRAIVDILRSIAHELVHMKQDLEGRLKPQNYKVDGADGSPIENEANAVAGILIRKFGKLHPEIYE